MGIALIDTGISLNYFDNVSSLESNVCFFDNKMCDGITPENVLTHGSICASIIRTYAPYAPLHSINVFINGVSNVENIIRSLHYCIEKNIKVVNISFGTNYIKDAIYLEKAIDLASSKGIIIVAATSKTGIVTYPAHYSKVIGVGVSSKLHLSKNEIVVNESSSSTVNVFACGTQRLYKNGRLSYISGNEPSYATAVVSALVYNELFEYNRETKKTKMVELLKRIQ